MEFVHAFLDLFRDLDGLVATAGYFGVTAIVFIETGLLFPFLPGDSLLVTAGLVCVTGTMNVWTLGLLCSVAAITGDQIAYGIGRRAGAALYARPDSRWFKQEHLRAAQAFYDRHGGKAIILARFMPFARTFAPVVAGAARMHYPTFISYNVIGGLAWIWSMLLTGYLIVERVPWLKAHVEQVVIAIVVVSVLPGIVGWWNSRGQGSGVR